MIFNIPTCKCLLSGMCIPMILVIPEIYFEAAHCVCLCVPFVLWPHHTLTLTNVMSVSDDISILFQYLLHCCIIIFTLCIDGHCVMPGWPLLSGYWPGDQCIVWYYWRIVWWYCAFQCLNMMAALSYCAFVCLCLVFCDDGKWREGVMTSDVRRVINDVVLMIPWYCVCVAV